MPPDVIVDKGQGLTKIWQGPEMLRRYPTTHPKVAVSPVFHLWQANEDFISVWAEVCGKTQLLVLQCGKSCPSNIYDFEFLLVLG
ncbi:hypothetical protein MGG_12954 [Pyricularia oryzae 70-15]|uniref:Uncharacterized protein n=1 Tax=Pyricularia oryzae (strain 70-15 / ATCC MYA-4617 / FGSC 8958) TaxID=242507 RepID=G4N3U0_PYRO7|nr:uncharacterized protein MGG_12954 [Pyricularia oryzae 70-15]EHA52713.1 hypothetical protein MGG_12954 [Pyricularia oryzae 70-15]